MQIRINLDSIFGSIREDTVSRSGYESYQPSEVGSQASSNNKIKMSIPIFDQATQETPKQNSKLYQSKTPSVTSIQTQFSQKMPGERLYYESRNNVARKTKEIERLMQQKQKEVEKQTTFKPKINKNSQRILQNKAKYQNSGFTKKQKESSKVLPTHLRKEQQQIVHCTFKPELIAKSISGNLRTKQKNLVFEQLFNDHRIKQVRQKLKTEQFDKQPEKKLSKQEFQKFLQRNNQFMSKVQKKNEIILTTSSKFDLQTGHKMFSPKTNTFKSHKKYFASPPEQISNKKTKNPPQIITKPIFSKNYQDFDNQQAQLPDFRMSNRQSPYGDRQRMQAQQIHQIHQASLDDEEEGLPNQSNNFQTVNAFQYDSDNQNKSKQEENRKIQQVDDPPVSHHSYNDDKIQQNTYFHDDQPHPSLGETNEHLHIQQADQEINQADKQSEEGQTHHEGGESRCYDQQ